MPVSGHWSPESFRYATELFSITMLTRTAHGSGVLPLRDARLWTLLAKLDTGIVASFPLSSERLIDAFAVVNGSRANG